MYTYTHPIYAIIILHISFNLKRGEQVVKKGREEIELKMVLQFTDGAVYSCEIQSNKHCRSCCRKSQLNLNLASYLFINFHFLRSGPTIYLCSISAEPFHSNTHTLLSKRKYHTFFLFHTQSVSLEPKQFTHLYVMLECS